MAFVVFAAHTEPFQYVQMKLLFAPFEVVTNARVPLALYAIDMPSLLVDVIEPSVVDPAPLIHVLPSQISAW